MAESVMQIRQLVHTKQEHHHCDWNSRLSSSLLTKDLEVQWGAIKFCCCCCFFFCCRRRRRRHRHCHLHHHHRCCAFRSSEKTSDRPTVSCTTSFFSQHPPWHWNRGDLITSSKFKKAVFAIFKTRSWDSVRMP